MTLPSAPELIDVVDHVSGITRITPAHPLFALRHQRDKVVSGTQGSYDALMAPDLQGLPLVNRLLVALYACRLSHADALAEHYRTQLLTTQVSPAWINAVDAAQTVPEADDVLLTQLAFTRTLIDNPIAGDKALLHTLVQAGMTTPAIVALAQWVAYLSYQLRLVAGLLAMKQAFDQPAMPSPIKPWAAQSATGNTISPIHINGFTNAVLDWKAWLDVVNPATATSEQIAVLEESNVKAKASDYYLLLVHQTLILRERSTAFNAIMYAPNGLSRAERELGSLVTSRINGCTYCASVHAQRFEQLAKRNDVVAQVFENLETAGTSARERAVIDASIALTASPQTFNASHIHALRAVGLTELETLDLIHSVALFAWANRLMLNLGEPVSTEVA
jgi:uncharacterized peroxidase-related enzyme